MNVYMYFKDSFKVGIGVCWLKTKKTPLTAYNKNYIHIYIYIYIYIYIISLLTNPRAVFQNVVTSDEKKY